jgi:hypothetical protein
MVDQSGVILVIDGVLVREYLGYVYKLIHQGFSKACPPPTITLFVRQPPPISKQYSLIYFRDTQRITNTMGLHPNPPPQAHLQPEPEKAAAQFGSQQPVTQQPQPVGAPAYSSQPVATGPKKKSTKTESTSKACLCCDGCCQCCLGIFACCAG